MPSVLRDKIISDCKRKQALLLLGIIGSCKLCSGDFDVRTD